MGWIKRSIDWINADTATNTMYSRQYKLICIVSLELIILGLLLVYINMVWQFTAIAYVIFFSCILATLNLVILKKTSNVNLCGHFITLLALIVTTICNYWIGGLYLSYLDWYYIIPIIAAVTIGWSCLLIYAGICVAIIGFFSLIQTTPIYHLASDDIIIMNFLNRSFSLLIIVTTLYIVLRENARYEKILNDHNYMLQADKEKFHYLARYDTLTNLPNRSYFLTHFQSMLDSADKNEQYFSVYFMDLDGFKTINDRYGHETGDALLLQAAKRLQACFRNDDFIARLGGDEFTALIQHQKDDEITKIIAKRIVDEFNQPFEIGGQLMDCKISIGLATYPIDATHIDDLIARADTAMYTVKKSGGSDYHLTKPFNKLFG